MAEKEDKGFKVVDRRAAKAGSDSSKQEVEGPGWQMHGTVADDAPLPADFTTFCISLASAALIHLGESPAPESGKVEKDLPLAKQTIDILEMLKDKTRGNLTEEETKLITTVLYDLRMRFVEASKTS